MNTKIDIHILQAYIDGELNAEETQNIDTRMRQNPEFAREVTEFQIAYDLAKRQWRNEIRQGLANPWRVFIRRYALAAAAVLAVIFTSVWFFWHDKPGASHQTIVQVNPVPASPEGPTPTGTGSTPTPINTHAQSSDRHLENRNLISMLTKPDTYRGFGNLPDSLLKADYSAGRYDSVLANTTLQKTPDERLFYRGLAWLNKDSTKQAISVFTQISQDGINSGLRKDAQWNLLVIYCMAPIENQSQICPLYASIKKQPYYSSALFVQSINTIDALLKKNGIDCSRQ